MYHPIKPCKQTNKKINPYSFKILKPFLIEKKIIGDQFWRCYKDQDSHLEDLEWRSILATSKISFEDQNPRYHLEDLEWSFEIPKKT